MTAASAAHEQDAVVAEIEIAAPPERVFRALTDAKQLFSWWGAEPSVQLSMFDMDARPGGRWVFRCTPAPGFDHGAVSEQLRRNQQQEFEAHGEVLECDPPRLLVWSWIANWHEQRSAPTIVRWELTASKEGTRVRVTHSRLSHEPIARKDYSGGWLGVLKLLRDYVQPIDSPRTPS
jgi:uncharacterized protein YndB with AHSA1/START domain